MKVVLKDFIYGGVIVILLFSLIWTLFDKPVKSENNVAKIVEIDSKPPVIKVDPAGRTHAQKEIVYVDDPTTIRRFQDQIDSLTVQLNIKSSQVAGVISGASEARTEIRPNIKAIIDSVKRTLTYEIDYKSRWLDLQGEVPSSLPFKVIQRDSTTLAFIAQRSGLFGLRKTYIANLSSANPDMKYYNLKAWQEVPRQKAKIGLGVTLGYGLQITKNNQITHGLQATGGIQFRF